MCYRCGHKHFFLLSMSVEIEKKKEERTGGGGIERIKVYYYNWGRKCYIILGQAKLLMDN